MSDYHSLVIAIERGKDYMVNPSADTVFQHGDIVWFVSPLDLQVKEFQEAHM
jgi:K+/H+ antiporter YhaU regulatory subunit KhtT